MLVRSAMIGSRARGGSVLRPMNVGVFQAKQMQGHRRLAFAGIILACFIAPPESAGLIVIALSTWGVHCDNQQAGAQLKYCKQINFHRPPYPIR